jgi:E3 ubiquitin-protein ligase MARCH6
MEILKPMTEFAFSSSSSTTSHTVWNVTAEDSLLSSIPDYLGFTEPYFEALGKEVRVTTVNAQSTWIELALGNGPTNRVFAITLGYIVVSFILALYLNILTVGNARSAGRAVRSAVRQQLLVLKVAAFIFIELVTFPLACGMVLDFCTIWLFPQASIHSRLASILHAPLTAMFYHWMAGTTFMYVDCVILLSTLLTCFLLGTALRCSWQALGL